MQATEEIKKQNYTQYLQKPEGFGWQLLNGELMESPAPYIAHQTILINLAILIKSFVESNNLGFIAIAPVDVYFNEENCVQPDILFISAERLHIITEKNIQGAPDLAIEIVSPGSLQIDTVLKKQLYAKFGVKEYWIVYPLQKMVEVYTLNNQEYNLTTSLNDVLFTNVLQGLQIDLKNVFKSTKS